MEKEIQNFNVKDFRTAQNSNGVIEGHAAIFWQYADIGGLFYEVIEGSAFDDCDLSDVYLFVNHDNNQIPLARSKVNDATSTMTLWVDDVGLAIRAKLDTENNQQAKDLYSAVARGDLNKMSFAFSRVEDEWEDLEKDMPIRHVKKIGKLWEVSAVNYPAYNATDLNIADRAKKILEAAKRKTSDEMELARIKAAIQETGKKLERELEEMKKETRTNYSEAGRALKSEENKVISPYSITGELRAVTVRPPTGDAAKIVVPTYSASTIQPTFPVVSTLIDSVQFFSIHGGESFKVPFVIGFDDVAYYTDELEDAPSIDVRFNYSELNKCKISAFAEISSEMERLPYAPYASFVFEFVRTSIRKAITKEILFGQGISEDGDFHRIVGIFSNCEKMTAIDPATDLSFSQITDTLLDKIQLAYGGDTDLDSAATLIISKQDLIALSMARSSVKSRLNEIVYTSSNTGRINGVPFIIDSNLPAITDPTTKSGEFCMAFGNPRNYSLVEFSPLTIEKTRDYRFPQGIVSFRGSAYVAGNVTRRNGFIRIKKA